MKVALLLGFSYGEDSKIKYVAADRNPLPGIVVDLYQGYTIAKQMNADKILVITDIIQDQQTSVLVNSMLDSTVDFGVLNFITNIRRDKQYYQFTSRESFIRMVGNFLSGSDEVFIYYTGHVDNGYLLFPMDGDDIDFGNNINTISQTYSINNSDESLKNSHTLKTYHLNHQSQPSNDNTKLSLIDFRTIITTSVLSSGQIFIVMDCCNSNGLDLPFHLNNDVYRLTPKKNHTFFQQKIICFSSTMSDEHSITTRDGSIFTRSLFLTLRDNFRKISDIIGKVGPICSNQFAQTTTIHSSYPNTKYIWEWIFSPSICNVYFDYDNNVIIVDINNEHDDIKKNERSQGDISINPTNYKNTDVCYI